MTTQLAKIQKNLKAPKGQFNKFGNYKYRSCEDILEAVKPLLGDLSLVISDEIVLVGDRFYVKAKAKLYTDKESIIAEAYAREEEVKKGMDGAQITGAASSYARKYALNGLFAIDDTKDSDVTNTHEKKDVAPPPKGIDDLSAKCREMANKVPDEKLKAKVLISIAKAESETELQRIYKKLTVIV